METMKSKMVQMTIAVLSIFAPFLLVGYALLINPDVFGYAMKSTPLTLADGVLSGIDWIWLIMLGAMMLGIFYWLFYIEDEEEITEEFMRLDTNHDGYISREEASKWKYLARVFDRVDTDHDGKLSRQEFEKAIH